MSAPTNTFGPGVWFWHVLRAQAFREQQQRSQKQRPDGPDAKLEKGA